MLRKDIIRTSPEVAGTADPEQIARFNALAQEWWSPHGQFKVVHKFNAARVGPILKLLGGSFDGRNPAVLSGLRVADIGCGAGLISEPLAKAGAAVTAIDASERNIAIARRHAKDAGLEINYRCSLPEQLAAEGASFDAVLSLEVVEHVTDVRLFLKTIAGLVRPGGRLILGTMNRTALSWLIGIVAAEWVLRWLPRGTHEWSRFVKPKETASLLKEFGFVEVELHGIVFNPFVWRWQASRSTAVNYLQSLHRAC
jgi:2-polyprenyl-6-hydroxyphenyl methylase/3-demethylubiquinone-9 3-methyltransferase